MMHTILKKLTSLVLVAFMVLSMVPIVAVTANAAEGDKTYTKVDLAGIKSTDKVIIVSTKGTASYAMSNDKAASAAPTAVSVTITDDTITTEATNILWNIASDSDKNLTIYPDGTTDKWLYCTATNNGVRVGTNANKIFTLDSTSGYLKHAATNRYLGVYNNQDWRCYTNTTGNIAGQTFSFYKLVDTSTPDPTVPTGCEHTNTENVAEVPATCTTPGTAAGVVCSDCGAIISGCEEIAATGHTYENGACTVCGEKQPQKYKLVTDIKALAEGSQIVIVYGNMAMGAQNDNYRGTVGITIADDTFEYIDGVCVLTLGGNSTDGWTLKASEGYLYCSNSKGNLNTSVELIEGCTWKINLDEGIQNEDYTTYYLQYNTSNPRFACYAGTLKNVSIFKLDCSHANTTDVPEEPATCTETGYTAGVYCNACGTYISGHEEIAALGHNWLGWTETDAATCIATGVQTGTCSRCGETKTVEIPTTDHTYVDGTCSVCGAEEPSASETSTATLTFDSTEKRKEYSTTKQVWVENEITFTNDKEKSITNVGNYSNPVRLYMDSSVTIEYAGMTKIEFTCNTADYATALGSSITDATVTVDDKIVTVTFTEAKDSFTISSLSKQVRLDSLTVTCKSSTGSSTESPNPIVKWNITLEDNLKVNFHLELNEGEQVYLKVGSAEVAYNLSDLTKTAEGYYVATVSMAAAQMTDDIKVQVINLTNEKLLANKTYSIRGYADAVLGSEKYPETTKALVNEMLNYGGAAQAFFGYNTGNLANAGITGAGVTPVPESAASDMNKTNDSDGCITFYGTSLVYRDKIAVRYYFDAKEGQNLTFVADGQEREPVLTGGHYMIEVPDICPQDYDTLITVTVTNAEGHSATVSYGPMNYIVRMYYKEGATTEMQNLLQALYNYHLAAVAYIAAQNP